MRRWNLDRECASDGSEHEARRDQHHVENDDVLADGRIEMDERDVDCDRDRKRRVDCCGQSERRERERDSEPGGESLFDLSSSDGSRAFYGVIAVDFGIHEVIDHVHRGGRQAKGDKHKHIPK